MGFRLSRCRVAQGHVAGARSVGKRFPVQRDFLVSFRGLGIGNRQSRACRRIVVVKLEGASCCTSPAAAAGRSPCWRGLLCRCCGPPGSTAALAPDYAWYAECDRQQDVRSTDVSHYKSLLARRLQLDLKFGQIGI